MDCNHLMDMSRLSHRGIPFVLRSRSPTAGHNKTGRSDFRQLTYGVVSEGVSAERVRKFCGKFAENTFYCTTKGCGNSAESLRKFRGNLRENFLQ